MCDAVFCRSFFVPRRSIHRRKSVVEPSGHLTFTFLSIHLCAVKHLSSRVWPTSVFPVFVHTIAVTMPCDGDVISAVGIPRIHASIIRQHCLPYDWTFIAVPGDVIIFIIITRVVEKESHRWTAAQRTAVPYTLLRFRPRFPADGLICHIR